MSGDTPTWAVITESFGKMHVVPLHDTHEHITQRHQGSDFFGTGRCWCNPTVENGQLFTHNAADGRERYEPHQYTPEDIEEYGDDIRNRGNT